MSDTPRPYERAEALAWAETRGDMRTVAVIHDLERELAEAREVIMNITMGRFAIEDTANGKKLTAWNDDTIDIARRET